MSRAQACSTDSVPPGGSAVSRQRDMHETTLGGKEGVEGGREGKQEGGRDTRAKPGNQLAINKTNDIIVFHQSPVFMWLTICSVTVYSVIVITTTVTSHIK